MSRELERDGAWGASWVWVWASLTLVASLMPFAQGKHLTWPWELFDLRVPNERIVAAEFLQPALALLAMVYAARRFPGPAAAVLFWSCVAALAARAMVGGTFGGWRELGGLRRDMAPAMAVLVACSLIAAGNSLGRARPRAQTPVWIAGLAGLALVVVYFLPLGPERNKKSLMEILTSADKWERWGQAATFTLVGIYGVLGAVRLFGRGKFLLALTSFWGRATVFLIPLLFAAQVFERVSRRKGETIINFIKPYGMTAGVIALMAIALVVWLAPLLKRDEPAAPVQAGDLLEEES